jgi:hypothetical protein
MTDVKTHGQLPLQDQAGPATFAGCFSPKSVSPPLTLESQSTMTRSQCMTCLATVGLTFLPMEEAIK